MAIAHAEHGQVIDLDSYGGTKSTALVKAKQFEVIRVVVEAGKSIPPHKVDGPITVQCLAGRCTFLVGEEPRELGPSCWLYLNGGATHAIEAAETSVLLVTILFGHSESPTSQGE